MKFPFFGRNPQPAIVMPLQESSDPYKWIPIGSGLRFNRDMMSPDVYERNNTAYIGWIKNPFIKRITEMWVNFVVGEGLTFTAKDPAAQDALDDFLKANHVHSKQKQRARELFLFGEQAIIPHVNVSTGNVKLGVLEPQSISGIEYDPFDSDTALAIMVRDSSGNPLRFPIVHRDERGLGNEAVPEYYGDKRPDGFSAKLDTTDRLVGRAFYTALNTVIGATRGVSDVVTVSDWCRSNEDLMWGALKRAQNQNRLFGVMIFKNATPAQLNLYRQREIDGKPNPSYFPPPGETGNQWSYANENVEFKFIHPEIGASDLGEAQKMFRSMIEIGAGLPEHFFGQGGDVNYATAKAMDSPFMQQMKSGQREICGLWKQIAEFAIDQKRIFTNELNGIETSEVDVSGPDISAKDEQYRATVAKTYTDTIVAWKASGWINDEQAIDLVQQIATAANLEIKQVENLIPQDQQNKDWTKEALKQIGDKAK